MGRKLKVLSGKEVVKILTGYGFVVTRTVGNHARMTVQTKHQNIFHITVPLHAELKRGTLHGIVSDFRETHRFRKTGSRFLYQITPLPTFDVGRLGEYGEFQLHTLGCDFLELFVQLGC